MVYKNANRRILLLVQAGAIEEIKYTERTPHGRIDYKLTMKGLEQLIPHFLSHPKEIKGLVEYMDKVSLDKNIFTISILNGYVLTVESLNEYQKYTGILYNPTKNIDINESPDSVRRYEDIHAKYQDINERLMPAMETMLVDRFTRLVEADNIEMVTKREATRKGIQKSIENLKKVWSNLSETERSKSPKRKG